MAFKDVANSFPGDINPPQPLVAQGQVNQAPIGFGHAQNVHNLQAPPKPPKVLAIYLERTAESSRVEPGHGLARIPLNPIDAATGNAPNAFVFGTRTQSFTPAAPPAGNHEEHFLLCPGDTTPVEIRWEIKHAAKVIWVRLELFTCGVEDQPVWIKDFGLPGNIQRFVPNAPQPNVTYYCWTFDGNIGAGGPTVTSHADPARFPGGWLTNEHGPYKLKVSILTARGVRSTRTEAWTYFHVPAHKFKLIRYMPSTELGSFGLEYIPGNQDLRIINKAFFAYESPPHVAGNVTHNPFSADDRTNNPLHEQIQNRMFEDWSAHFELRVGGDAVRPLVFVQDHHVADVDHTNDQNPYAAYLAEQCRQNGCDFPVQIRNVNGVSNVSPSVHGHYLILQYNAFSDVSVSPGLASSVYQYDVGLVREKMKEAVATAPLTVTSASQPNINPQYPDSFTITLRVPPHTTGLDNATAQWIQNTLVPAMNSAIPAIGNTIPVVVTGYSRAHRQGNSKRTRAAANAVKLLLAGLQGPPPPGVAAPQKATDIRQAQAGFDIRPEQLLNGTASGRRITIDVDVPPGGNSQAPQQYPYNTFLHEFGHVFGLPDEYQDYDTPGSPCRSIASSQPRMLTLCNLYPCTPPVFPKGNDRILGMHLMSTGTVFYERYCVTFAEALQKLVSLDPVAPSQVSIGGPANRNNLVIGNYNPVEDPAFTTLANAIRAAINTFERGHLQIPAVNPPRLIPADILADIRTQAGNAGLATLLYHNVVDSDGVVPALSANRPGFRHFARAAVLVDDECVHCAIAAEPLRAQVVLDVNQGVLENTATFPACGTPRVHVVLRATRAFAGTGRVTLSANNVVRLHSAPNGGNVVNAGTAYQGGANAGELAHAQGVSLWAEGIGHGTVNVGLELLDNNAVLIARAEPTPVHSVRPVDVFIDGEPAGDHLCVPLHGGLNSNLPRTKITIRKKPNLNYGGQLVQIGRVARGNGDFAIYDANGGGPQGLPYGVLDNTYQNNVVNLELEGTTGSNALDDHDLTFSLGGTVLHTVQTTVVTLHDLEITIPATPPLTARTVGLTAVLGPVPRTDPNAAQNANAAVAHVIKPHIANQGFWNAGQVPMPVPNVILHADYGSDDFAVNTPLVLVEGSLPGGSPVSIKATIEPNNTPAQWMVERDDDDEERIIRLAPGREVPTLQNAPGVVNGANLEITGQLSLNHVGSFHVRLRCGSAQLLTVNLLLVRAEAVPDADDSRAEKPSSVSEINRDHLNGVAADQYIQTRLGTFTGAQIDTGSEKRFGCILRGKVRFIGGGADGRLGKGKVFAGWIQNMTRYLVVGRYNDSAGGGLSNVQMQVLRNVVLGQGRPNNDFYFTNMGVPVVSLDGGVVGTEVLLDTGRRPAGGASVCLGSCTAHDPVDEEEIGWSIIVSAADSPGTEFFLRHPGTATSLLTEVHYAHTFRSFLSVWADATEPTTVDINAGRNSRAAADRLFGVVGELEWRLHGAWDVEIKPGAWYGAGNGGIQIPANKVKLREKGGYGFSGHISRPFQAYPTRPAEGLAEVKAPTMLMTFGWRAY